MGPHTEESRQVIGIPDMHWHAVIIAWCFGLVVTFALWFIDNDIWILLATFLALALGMTYRIVLTRQSIRIALIIPFISKELCWRDISGVTLHESTDSVHLLLASGGSISLPQWLTRCEADTLADVCSNWHGTHRLRTCPSCGYDLFGTMSPTCPECGREITIEHQFDGPSAQQSPIVESDESSEQATIQ